MNVSITAKNAKKTPMNIISVSRRTDIPAFYPKWFMERVRAGFVKYRNPFSGQIYQISLKPEDVVCFVFWSKNYKPLLPYLDELHQRGFDFYFHFTITGLPRALEQHVIAPSRAIQTLQFLSDTWGPNRVHWRFDPIIVSDITPLSFYLQQFEKIAVQLTGYTTQCIFSFAQFYTKVLRNLIELTKLQGICIYDIDRVEKIKLAESLADIAHANGIRMLACCNDFLLSEKIQKAHCVDGHLIAELFPHKSFQAGLNSTRKECGCTDSRDIGEYDTCPHGCVYCYANKSPLIALKHFRRHNPKSVILN